MNICFVGCHPCTLIPSQQLDIVHSEPRYIGLLPCPNRLRESPSCDTFMYRVPLRAPFDCTNQLSFLLFLGTTSPQSSTKKPDIALHIFCPHDKSFPSTFLLLQVGCSSLLTGLSRRICCHIGRQLVFSTGRIAVVNSGPSSTQLQPFFLGYSSFDHVNH